MEKKKGYNGMGKVARLIFMIIFSIIILSMVIFMIFIKPGRDLKTRNRALEKAYPEEIERHLEEKYMQKFVVDPIPEARPHGPIPRGDTNLPYIYEVREYGGDEYVFRVYVNANSVKDKTIKMIRDNYCYKFFKEKIKEKFREEMKGVLPDEYKMLLIAHPTLLFDDSIRPDSMIEDYFKASSNMIHVTFYIIGPPENKIENFELMENNLYPILSDFYEENVKNMEIYFHYFETKTADEYININVQQIEEDVFLRKGRVWSFVEIEKKMSIIIEEGK